MEILVMVLHVFAALGIIGLVLIQHGKGADVGAAFGGGISGSLFGSSGSANFLSRATATLAAVFFLTSMGLTYFSSRKSEQHGVMTAPSAPVQSVPGQIQPPVVPAAPAGAVPSAPNPNSKAGEVPK